MNKDIKKEETELVIKLINVLNLYLNEDLSFYAEIYNTALTGILEEIYKLKISSQNLTDEKKQVLQFLHNSNNIYTFCDRLDFLAKIKKITFNEYSSVYEILSNLDENIITFV